MTTDTPPPSKTPKPKTPREAKLAEALRANLRRRKQGKVEIAPAAEPHVPPSDPASS